MFRTSSYNSSWRQHLLQFLLLRLIVTCRSKEFQPRIVGGITTRIEFFPFMTYIKIEKGGGVAVCGGTYMHEYWVLTAAHCVYLPAHAPNRTVFAQVHMGMTNRLKHNDPNRQIRQSTEIVKHPKYQKTQAPSPKTGYDIGLIKLDKPFIISECVQLAELPLTRMNYSGVHVFAIGWGRLNPSNPRKPNDLQALRTSVWKDNSRKCQSVPNDPICIGRKRKHGSFGDSGGPLIYSGMVIGVLSHGSSKGVVPKTVFENVFSHLVWIMPRIGVSDGAMLLAERARSSSFTNVLASNTLILILSNFSVLFYFFYRINIALHY